MLLQLPVEVIVNILDNFLIGKDLIKFYFIISDKDRKKILKQTENRC